MSYDKTLVSLNDKLRLRLRKFVWRTETDQRWNSFVFLAALRQLSVPTAERQKQLMGTTVAEAVYIMWIWPWTYGWCRNREPGALISILQTITHKGFLLSASATVCSPFVQLSMSTMLLNSCAGFFCSSRDTLKPMKTSLRRDVGFEGTLANELENCIDNVDCHSLDWRECVRPDK